MMVEIEVRAASTDRFMPAAFDSAIGREVPFTVEGARVGVGVLRRAVVVDEGRAARLSFEVPDDVEALVGDAESVQFLTLRPARSGPGGRAPRSP